MVDSRERRVIPQPRSRQGIAREFGGGVAGRHQDPGRRDQDAAGRRRDASDSDGSGGKVVGMTKSGLLALAIGIALPLLVVALYAGFGGPDVLPRAPVTGAPLAPDATARAIPTRADL